MFIIPITKSWLVSRTADRIYFVCALSTLFFFATEFVFVSLRRNGLGGDSSLFLILFRMIQLSIPGFALLWVAMWMHWIKFNIAKRGFWVLGLIMGPLGLVAYYFVVYRKDNREMLREGVVITTPVATNP